MKSEDKVKLCRVVGVLILSDGQLTDEEYDFFYGLMDRLELTEEERANVRGSVQIDANVRADVEELRTNGEAQRLLDELQKAATADGEIARIEDSLIDKIRAIINEA